jgi:hypothetical protein
VSKPAGESDGADTVPFLCCLEAPHREHGIVLKRSISDAIYRQLRMTQTGRRWRY